MKIRLLMSLTLLFLAGFLIFIPSAFAQERLMLTLSGAIELSIKNNMSIAEKGILFKIAESQAKTAEGEFDPALKFQLNESYTKSPAVSAFLSETERESGYDISFGGKVNTGTAYELKLIGRRVRRNESPFITVNPYYSSDLALSITQPLLKGFGKSIQESNLRVAKTNIEISRLGTEMKTEDIIALTASSYWNCYFARSNFEAAGLSLRLAQSLLEEVKSRIDAGTLAPVEIYKAESEAAVRQENLLKAKKAMFDSEDKLRAVMNIEDWQTEIVLLGSPIEADIGLPTFEDAFNEALEKRRDYKSLIAEQKSKAILRRFYENQRLPDLDVVASSGLSGINKSHSDSLGEMREGSYHSWMVGLALTVPLGNRAAKGNYLKARLDEERANINIEALKQDIKMNLKDSLRAVGLAKESILAARATKAASEKRLNAEEARFKLGMATLNDVLKFQEEYAQALSSEKRAMADYAISVVVLEKAKGTLLENWKNLH